MKAEVQGESMQPEPARQAGAPRGDPKGGDFAVVMSLDRFLKKRMEDCWQELSNNLGGNRGRLEFSGILPLGDPGLLPYMDQPGVFLLLGPTPSLPILTIGYSQAPLSGAISAKISYLIERQGAAAAHGSTPMYIACISMEEEWSIVRPYWALLNRRI